MSLPRDLDLTTLSETYLLAMLDDQRKQDDEDARQINEIQVRRATRDEMRGKLSAELDRRAEPYTDAERRQLQADFERQVYKDNSD